MLDNNNLYADILDNHKSKDGRNLLLYKLKNIWVIIIPETQNKGTKMLDDRALQFDLNIKKYTGKWIYQY